MYLAKVDVNSRLQLYICPLLISKEEIVYISDHPLQGRLTTKCIRASKEMEWEPVTRLPLLATLHRTSSSSTLTELVQQCRREPPTVYFFIVRTRKKEMLLLYACYVRLMSDRSKGTQSQEAIHTQKAGYLVSSTTEGIQLKCAWVETLSRNHLTSVSPQLWQQWRVSDHLWP